MTVHIIKTVMRLDQEVFTRDISVLEMNIIIRHKSIDDFQKTEYMSGHSALLRGSTGKKWH